MKTRSLFSRVSLFVLFSLCLNRFAAAQCPVTALSAQFATALTGTAIDVGSSYTLNVVVTYTTASAFKLELGTLNNLWNISPPSGVTSAGYTSSGNALFTMPSASGTQTYAFSITPYCPTSTFNSNINNTFNLANLNVYFPSYSSGATPTCTFINTPTQPIFSIGFPHIQYEVCDGIFPTSIVQPTTITGLGTILAIKDRYYMRQVVITNNGTQPLTFGANGFGNQLSILNTNTTGTGIEEYEVIDIYDAPPSGFQNGQLTLPAAGLGLTISSNSPTLPTIYSYDLNASNISTIHYDNTGTLATSNTQLDPGDELIYYELIQIKVCGGSTASGFYASDMNFDWSYTNSTPCTSTQHFNSIGNTLSHSVFNKQPSNPSLGVSNVVINPHSGSSFYCYDQQVLDASFEIKNNTLNTVADEVIVDLYRRRNVGSSEDYFTDIKNIQSIKWYDESSTTVPIAEWIASGTYIIDAQGTASATVLTDANGYKVTYTKSNISGLAASICGGGFADRITLDFSVATNGTGNLPLRLVNPLTGNTGKIVITYQTLTCSPAACNTACPGNEAVAQNIYCNAKFFGSCGGTVKYMNGSGSTYNVTSAGIVIYKRNAANINNCHDHVAGAVEVTREAGILFTGATALIGGWNSNPASGPLYGNIYNTLVHFNGGTDLWSGNGTNQAIEIDVLLDPSVYLDGNTGNGPFITFAGGSPIDISSYLFTVTGAGSPTSPNTYASIDPTLDYYTSPQLSEHGCETSLTGYEHVYRFRLTWANLVTLGVWTNTTSGCNVPVKPKLNGMTLSLNVRQLCPIDPNSASPGAKIYLYHLPDLTNTTCNEKILVECGEMSYSLQCPGCHNQGIESTDMSITRLTYGYEDADDDGLWDAQTPVTATTSGVNTQNVMVGDEFEVKLTTHIDLWNTVSCSSSSAGSSANGNYYPSDGPSNGDLLFENGYWYLVFDFGGLQDVSNVLLEDITVDYFDNCPNFDPSLYYGVSHVGSTGTYPTLSGTFSFTTLPSAGLYSPPTLCASSLMQFIPSFNTKVFYKIDFSLSGNSNMTWSSPGSYPAPVYFPDGAQLTFHAKFKQAGNAGSDFSSNTMTEAAHAESRVYLTLQAESAMTANGGAAIDPTSIPGFTFYDNQTLTGTDCGSGLATVGGCSITCSDIQWHCTNMSADYNQIGYKLRESLHINDYNSVNTSANGCSYNFAFTRVFELGQPMNAYNSNRGNYFPYEYRNWDYLTKLNVNTPTGFVLSGIIAENINARGINPVASPNYVNSGGVFDFLNPSYTYLFNGADNNTGNISLASQIPAADEAYGVRLVIEFTADCNTPNYTTTPAAFTCTSYDYIDPMLDNAKYDTHATGYSIVDHTNNPYQAWTPGQENVQRENAVADIFPWTNSITAYDKCIEWFVNINNTNSNNTYSLDAYLTWVMIPAASVANISSFQIDYKDINGVFQPMVTNSGGTVTGSYSANVAYYMPVAIPAGGVSYTTVRIRACLTTLCNTSTHFNLTAGVACGALNTTTPASVCIPVPPTPALDVETLTINTPANPQMACTYFYLGGFPPNTNTPLPLTFSACNQAWTYTLQVENTGDLFIHGINGDITLPPGIQLNNITLNYNGGAYPVNVASQISSSSSLPSPVINGPIHFTINGPLYNIIYNCALCSSGATDGWLPSTSMAENPDDLFLTFEVESNCCEPANAIDYIYTTINGTACTSGDLAQFLVPIHNTINQSGVQIAVTGATTTCTGSPVQLDITGLTGITWTSSPTTGISFSSTTALTTNVTFSASGTYTIFVAGVNGNGFNCSGSIVITVNPTPVATATPSSQTICSGSATSISLTSSVSGSTFAWTVSQSGVTGASNGSGSSIAQTLTNSGTSAGIATYSVVPTANGCVGSATNVVVTVNPIPVATATPSSQTICTGAATSIALTSNVSGSTFAWTVSQSGVTGASNGSGSSIAQTLTNSGTTAGTATYSITPTANACPGSAITVIVTVNPAPVVTATPSAQTICPGTATSISLTTGVSGTTFAWTVSQSGVTGASNGSGSTIAQTLSNSGSSSGTATYSVTGTANGCTGSATSVVVTVTPFATITNSPMNQTICNGTSSASVTWSASPSGTTTYAWSGSSSNGVTGYTSSGTGNLPSMTLSYSGITQGSVVYSVTPTVNGCTGTAATYTIYVNPIPTVTLTYPIPTGICSSATSWLLTGSGSPSGGTYTFTGTSLTNNGNGTATFNPSSAGVGSYSLSCTYTLNGCTSSSSSVTVTVVSCSTAVCTTPSGFIPISSTNLLNNITATGQRYHFVGAGGIIQMQGTCNFTDCEFLFDDNVAINILSNSTLNLTSITPYPGNMWLHACSENWGGININDAVYTNSHLNCIGHDYLNGSDNNPVLIQDAGNPVNGSGNVTNTTVLTIGAVNCNEITTSSSSSISLLFTCFDRCEIGINLRNTNNNLFSGTYPATIEGCQFLTTSTPLHDSQLRGQYGIYAKLNATAPLIIGNNSGFRNKFADIETGIYLLNRTSAIINNNEFKRITFHTSQGNMSGHCIYADGNNTSQGAGNLVEIGTQGATHATGFSDLNYFEGSDHGITIDNYRSPTGTTNNHINIYDNFLTGMNVRCISTINQMKDDIVNIEENTLVDNGAANGILISCNSNTQGNCVYTIADNVLTNSSPTAGQKGIEVDNLFAYTTSAYPHYYIENNQIENWGVGILASGIFSPAASTTTPPALNIGVGNSNIITFTSVPSTGNNFYGIRVQSGASTGMGNNPRIENNSVTGVSNTGGKSNNASRIIGIETDMTPSPNICNNALNNLQYGINCLGNNGPQAYIKLNQMDYCDAAFHLDNNSGGNGGEIGPQGSPGSGNNKATNNFWGLGSNMNNSLILHYNGLNTNPGAQARWYYDNSLGGNYDLYALYTSASSLFSFTSFATQSLPATNWQLTSPSSPTCTAYNSLRVSETDNDSTITIDGIMTQLVAGLIADSSNLLDDTEGKVLCMYKNAIFNAIETNQSIDLSNDTISQFMDMATNSNIGKFAEIDSLISVRNEMDSTYYLEDSMFLSYIIAENTQITPSNSIETYRKELNSIILQNTLNQVAEFTETQKEFIATLSNECAYNYGPIVFSARIMRSQFDTAYYVYDQNCEFSGSRKSNTLNVKDWIKVYPNPTNDIIYVSLENTCCDSWIVITDNLGREVLRKKISKDEKTIELNLGNFPSGVYFYKWKGISGESANGKIILTK